VEILTLPNLKAWRVSNSATLSQSNLLPGCIMVERLVKDYPEFLDGYYNGTYPSLIK
jgi:hypothetical protein